MLYVREILLSAVFTSYRRLFAGVISCNSALCRGVVPIDTRSFDSKNFSGETRAFLNWKSEVTQAQQHEFLKRFREGVEKLGIKFLYYLFTPFGSEYTHIIVFEAKNYAAIDSIVGDAECMQLQRELLEKAEHYGMITRPLPIP
jgi:hypothetical protein